MIVCAGEALIDMLPRQMPDGADVFLPVAGGAVFNTSIALGRLGAPVSLVTGLSRDLFGQVLEGSLEASGVASDQAVRSDNPTTLAFVTLTDGHASYAFYDENTAGRMLRPEDMPVLDERVEALFCGGISLAVEPCASAYAALAMREAPRRVLMVDPNIRPGFIADADGFRSRISDVMASADIVKVSDEDLTWLLGAGRAPDQAAQLMARGTRLVCVTEGARGVTAYTPTGAVHVAATPVTVADTVGAGDTFNAGLLAGLREAGLLSKPALEALPEEGLRAALSLGVRAAAITVSRVGANPPRRDELA